jgi:hypothetical protein
MNVFGQIISDKDAMTEGKPYGITAPKHILINIIVNTGKNFTTNLPSNWTCRAFSLEKCNW